MQKVYEVWHADPPDFWSARKVEEFPNGWVKVADVTAECPDGVYETTQHIDRNWSMNTNVRAVTPQVRSTSVGDIVLTGTIAYRCEPTGWSSHNINLTKEQAR